MLRLRSCRLLRLRLLRLWRLLLLLRRRHWRRLLTLNGNLWWRFCLLFVFTVSRIMFASLAAAGQVSRLGWCHAIQNCFACQPQGRNPILGSIGTRIGPKDEFVIQVEHSNNEAMIRRKVDIINILHSLDGNLVQRFQSSCASYRIGGLSLNPQSGFFSGPSSRYQTDEHFLPHDSHFGSTLLFQPSVGNQCRTGIDRTLKGRSLIFGFGRSAFRPFAPGR